MKKRILSISLVLCLVLSLIPTLALATETGDLTPNPITENGDGNGNDGDGNTDAIPPATDGGENGNDGDRVMTTVANEEENGAINVNSAEDLKAKIESANDAIEINLTGNIDLDGAILVPEGADITIHGDGHTITFPGTGQMGKTVFTNLDGNLDGLHLGTKLTVDNVKFVGQNTSSQGYAVIIGFNSDGTSVTLTDCTFENLYTAVIANHVSEDGCTYKLSITDCTYKNTSHGYSIDIITAGAKTDAAKVTFTNNTGYGDSESEFSLVAKVGDTDYPTFEKALDALKTTENQTLTLLQDVEITESITVLPENATLDGNGHTITAVKAGADWPTTDNKGSGYMLSVEEKDNVTIKNVILDGKNVPNTKGLQFFNCKDGNLDTVTVRDTDKAWARLTLNASSVTAIDTLDLGGGQSNLGFGTTTGLENPTIFNAEGAALKNILNFYSGADDISRARTANSSITGTFPKGWDMCYTGSSFEERGYAWTNTLDGLEAQVGDHKYFSLALAIIDATEDKDVKLLKDTSSNITIPTNKVINLNLNDKKLTGAVTVETSGKLTINAGAKELKSTGGIVGTLTNNGGLTINSGLYSVDPTAFLEDGFVAVASDLGLAGYNYKVVEKAVDEKTAVVADTPTVPVLTEKEKEGKEEEVIKAMEAVQKELADATTKIEADVSAAAQSVTNDATVITNKVTSTALKELNPTSAPEVTITYVVVPYLDIKINDATLMASNSIKTITYDINPMYNLFATTEEVKAGTVPTEGKGTIKISKDPQPLDVTTSVEISLPLPTKFITRPNAFVTHSKTNGASYVYTGTVVGGTLTFTNPNGFSGFEVSQTNPSVAQIGDKLYGSLQTAVDAVEEGGTIILLASGSATVNQAKSFKVESKPSDPYTANLSAGSGYRLTDDGNGNYTSTKRSSGSSSSSKTYKVTIEDSSKGKVTVNDSSVSKGDTVTVTVKPNDGYKLDELIITDKDGNEIKVTDKGNNKYSFKMPNTAVTIDPIFIRDNDDDDEEEDDTKDPIKEEDTHSFIDVADSAWYADAVQFVYDEGMMSGISANQFGPNGSTTRGMIATILYRLEGQPVAGTNGFTDVADSQYYANAIAWAAENKIVSGYGDGTFGPMDNITREQMAAIMYRYATYKGYDVTGRADLSTFSDVASVNNYALVAMQWANDASLIMGDNNALDPAGNATRSQVAAIMMRFCNSIAE